jgi:peptidoglycan/LPS O-acetylase OafA/YrhL
LIDLLKAAGCLLIVLHHLAFYGPMSDVVATAWPGLVGWLYDHARLAVQVFLVCAGFLTAGGLARHASLAWREALQLAWLRYMRLAIPLLAALSFTVLVSEGVRPGFDHPSLSAEPAWGQALAHILLAQHLLDMEALSAGIWYVAIDLQLYAMAVLSLVLVSAWHAAWGESRPLAQGHALQSQRLRWALWLGLCAASLWWWNVQAELDDLGVYFFGAYGLGMLAWAGRAVSNSVAPRAQWCRWAIAACWLVLGLVAWWLQARWRIALAWGVAGVLMAVPAAWWATQTVSDANRLPRWRAAIVWLSSVSYSVFLIHFGVSLAVSAVVTALGSAALWAHAAGMLVSLLLSLLCGGLLYLGVERHPPTVRRWLWWVAVFMGSVGVAMS